MFETQFAQTQFDLFASYSQDWLCSQEGINAIHEIKFQIAEVSRKDAHLFGNKIMEVMYAE